MTAAADPAVETLLDGCPGWSRVAAGDSVLWFSGHARQGLDAGALAPEVAALEPERVPAWLDGLDGHFALVVSGPTWAVAAVDAVRSIPVLYARSAGTVLIGQSGAPLLDRLGLGPADIDPDQALAYALAGFTAGSATLYPRIRQIDPGCYILVRPGGATETGRYHRWRPWLPEPAEPDDLVAPLSALHRRLIDDLVRSTAGRPILVPLSAGLDSRMIASGLAEAGYGNVRCFTYGRAGNREAVTSREVATRLGFPWTFVPYTNGLIRRHAATDGHARYLRHADSLTGVPFPQDHPALADLARRGWISPDTLVVNGQTGDFITGNHVPAALFDPRDDGTPVRHRRVVDALLAKHFKHWLALETQEVRTPIVHLLESTIAALGGMPDDPAGDHGIYEAVEFLDRQSKYVINGQRLYEHMGLGWRLPLWDRACLDFWEKAPLSAKRRQGLYRRVLERDDWGGVWRDIPVNPLRIRPSWLVPVRFLLKVLHAPLGRARWHRFETRFLDYWMAPLCTYGAWPYLRVAFDRRGHRTPIAWHAAEGLGRHGLDWRGRPHR